jgi:hypothetical protein
VCPDNQYLNIGNFVENINFFFSMSYNGILQFTNSFNFTLDNISWLKENINKCAVERNRNLIRSLFPG